FEAGEAAEAEEAGAREDHEEDLEEVVRRHGPFEPHRLPLDEMAYTTTPGVSAKLTDRWETVAAPAVPAHAPGA
ncbi:MAG TPA: fructose 1,6-bisphosphatase, partial [Acidimicrobiales bacterium]|nr:fructose 1,6-bisphosphatase [Acidimicrobiales bacterium]